MIKSLIKYFLDKEYQTLNRRLPNGFCQLSKVLRRSEYTKMSKTELCLLVHVVVESSRKQDKESIDNNLLIRLRPEENVDICANHSRFREARSLLVDKGILVKHEEKEHYYYYNPTILNGLTWGQVKKLGFMDWESRIKNLNTEI